MELSFQFSFCGSLQGHYKSLLLKQTKPKLDLVAVSSLLARRRHFSVSSVVFVFLFKKRAIVVSLVTHKSNTCSHVEKQLCCVKKSLFYQLHPWVYMGCNVIFGCTSCSGEVNSLRFPSLSLHDESHSLIFNVSNVTNPYFWS